MWAQKARSNWILNGDKNTRYFQTIVRQRRARSRILHIKDEEGLLLEDPMEIENRLANHFKSSYEDIALLSADSILSELQTIDIPKLTHQQCLEMNRLVTNLEIEDTIFQLGPHKAYGPDGIPAFFYQQYWELVKSDVVNTIQAFFHSRSLFKPLNHTFITLIPKIPFPDEVTHFRPISLCNVIYKTISKILVNRLKPFMDSLISPFQNAFIKGRKISDNILIAYEIMEILRKKKGRKGSFGALKIDMKKAYDRASWNFLRAVLIAMNFNQQ